MSFLIAVAFSWLIQNSYSSPTTNPNVIFFLVDDMGWADCGICGSKFYKTPNIDKFASTGLRFTNAYAANPSCSPTRASILTGKYPARLGITNPNCHLPPPVNISSHEKVKPHMQLQTPESMRYLDPNIPNLPRTMQSAGYVTAHIGKWHLGITPPHWPQNYGYDVVWHGIPDSGPPIPNGYFHPYSFRGGNIDVNSSTVSCASTLDNCEPEYLTDRLTTEAVNFIDDMQRKNKEAETKSPFFLYVSHFGVHGPQEHKEGYTKKYLEQVKRIVSSGDSEGDPNSPAQHACNAVMASMLQSIDDSLGKVVQAVTSHGMAQDTIIFFTSDNGGVARVQLPPDTNSIMVAWRNPQTRWVSRYVKYARFQPPTTNFPLREGKGMLYEGGVRVPLMVRWDGKISPNTVTSEVVSSIDFYSTIVELALGKTSSAYSELMEPGKVDGLSYASLLLSPQRDANGPVATTPKPLKTRHFREDEDICTESLFDASGRHTSSVNGTWWRGHKKGLFNFFPHGGPFNPPGASVMYYDWKLIRRFQTGFTLDKTLELFNLLDDESECCNVAERYPTIAQDLDAMIDEFLVETKAVLPVPNPDYDPALFKKIQDSRNEDPWSAWCHCATDDFKPTYPNMYSCKQVYNEFEWDAVMSS